MVTSKSLKSFIYSELQDYHYSGKIKSAKLCSIEPVEQCGLYVSQNVKKRINRIVSTSATGETQFKYLITEPNCKVIRYSISDKEVQLMVERFLLSSFSEVDIKNKAPVGEEKQKKIEKTKKQKKNKQEVSCGVGGSNPHHSPVNDGNIVASKLRTHNPHNDLPFEHESKSIWSKDPIKPTVKKLNRFERRRELRHEKNSVKFSADVVSGVDDEAISKKANEPPGEVLLFNNSYGGLEAGSSACYMSQAMFDFSSFVPQINLDISEETASGIATGIARIGDGVTKIASDGINITHNVNVKGLDVESLGLDIGNLGSNVGRISSNGISVNHTFSGDGKLAEGVSLIGQAAALAATTGISVDHNLPGLSGEIDVLGWTKLVALSSAIAWPIYQQAVYGEMSPAASVSLCTALFYNWDREFVERMTRRILDLPQYTGNGYHSQSAIDEISDTLLAILIDLWGEIASFDVKDFIKTSVIVCFLKDYNRVKLSLTSFVSDLKALLVAALNFIRVKILGLDRLRAYDTGFTQIDAFMKTCFNLSRKFSLGEVTYTYDTFKLYMSIINEGEELLRLCVNKDFSTHRANVLYALQDLKKWGKAFDSLNISFGKVKVKSVNVLIRGSPGTGKSMMLHPMALEVLTCIIPDEYREIFDNNPDAFIYLRLFANKYWDGYGPLKLAIIYDDFDQSVDVAGNPDSEAAESIMLGHKFPTMLHCADMAHKNRTWSVAELIIYSTNTKEFHFQSVRNPEAVKRRMDLVYDCCPRVEFMKTGSEGPIDGDIWSRRLDRSKVKSALDFSIYEFHEYDLLKECYTGLVLSYNQVVTKILEVHAQFKAEHEQYQLVISDLVTSRQEMKTRGIQNRDGFTPLDIIGISTEESVPLPIQESLFKKMTCYLDTVGLLPVYENYKLFSDFFKANILSLDDCMDLLRGGFYFDSAHFLATNAPQYPASGEVPSYPETVKRAIVPKEGLVRAWIDKFRRMEAFIAVGFTAAALGLYHVSHRESRAKAESDQKLDAAKDAEIARLRNLLAERCGDDDVVEHVCCDSVNYQSYAPKSAQRKASKMKRNAVVYDTVLQAPESTYNPPVIVVNPKSVDVIEDMFKVHPKAEHIPTTVDLHLSRLDGVHDPKLFTSCEAIEVEEHKLSVVDIVVEQQGADLGLDDVIAKVSKSNIYYFELGNTRFGTGVFLKGRVFLMPAHFRTLCVKVSDKDLDIHLVKVSSSRRHTFPMKNFLSYPHIMSPISDACLIKFDHVEMHCNILGLFAQSSFFKHRVGFEAMMVNCRADEKQSSKALISRLANPIRNELGEPTSDRIVIAMRLNTVSGDCGALVYINEKQAGCRRIVGMHIAGGTNSPIALSVPLCLTGLLTEADKLEPIDNPHDTFRQQCAPVGSLPMLEVNFRVPFIFHPKVSNYVQSQVYSAYKTPTLGPVHLDKIDLGAGIQDPWYNSLMKIHKKDFPFFDPLTLRRSSVDVLDKLCRASELYPTSMRSLFSFEDSITGVPGLEFCEGITRNTSPGYPLQILVPHGMGGKKFWFGEDGPYNLAGPHVEKLRRRVEFVIEQCKEGIMPELYCKPFHKDERKKLVKVSEVCPRIVDATGLERVIVTRMYFLAFSMSFSQCRIHNGSAVGINPYSYEWDVLARVLTSVSDHVLDVDYKTFDACHGSQILTEVVWIINQWYADSDENKRVREMLFLCLINSKHALMNFVYTSFGGLPSGDGNTVIINSLCNLILTRYSYATIVGDFRFECFSANVSEIVYGDDLVIAVTEEYRDKFNYQNISQILSNVGYTITTAAKDGVHSGFKHISKATFLKRAFRFDGDVGRCVAPLDLDVVLEIPYWLKRGNDEDQLIINAKTAFRELTLHGYDVFHEWAPKIAQAINTRTGRNLPVGDYHVHLSDMLQQETCYITN